MNYDILFFAVDEVYGKQSKTLQRKCDSGSVGGARPCQGRGRGFESRLSLEDYKKRYPVGYLFLVMFEDQVLKRVRGLRALAGSSVGAKRRSNKRNASLIIHPQDRERMLAAIDKDHLLSVLEGKH